MSNNNPQNVMRLNLDLCLEDFSPMVLETLRRHCDAKQGYSREILVPSDMPLYALHYVILQAFGWEAVSGHTFSLPNDMVNDLTQKRLDDYLDMAGVYFAGPDIPCKTDETDDDFGFINPDASEKNKKSWFRKSYTPPYPFPPQIDSFMTARSKAEAFRMIAYHKDYKKTFLKVGQEESNSNTPTNDNQEIMTSSFACILMRTYGELLKSLKLSEILTCAKVDKNVIKNQQQQNNNSFLETGNTLLELKKKKISKKDIHDFLASVKSIAHPITNTLNYECLYYRNWDITITCNACYTEHDLGTLNPQLSKQIQTVMDTRRPLCIKLNGNRQLPHCIDDINNFCNLLINLKSKDADLKQKMLNFAKERGWDLHKYSADTLL